MKTTTIIMVLLTPFISFGIGYQQGRKAELSQQIERLEAETVELEAESVGLESADMEIFYGEAPEDFTGSCIILNPKSDEQKLLERQVEMLEKIAASMEGE